MCKDDISSAPSLSVKKIGPTALVVPEDIELNTKLYAIIGKSFKSIVFSEHKDTVSDIYDDQSDQNKGYLTCG